MSGFLYFIPGPTASTSETTIADAGLAYAFDDPTKFTACGVQSGPGGRGGVLVSDPAHMPAERTRYDPKRASEWRAIPQADAGGTEGVMLLAHGTPGPDELVVNEPIAGHEITLGDDNRWMVPLARAVVPHDGGLSPVIALPRRAEIQPDGTWAAGDVWSKHKRLWSLAEQWADVIMRATVEDGDDGKDASTVTFDLSPHDLAVEVLGFNYRLRRTEASSLGLFDADSRYAADVLGALIDLPTIKAWLTAKKNDRAESGGSSSTVGDAVATPGTAQA